MSKIIYPNKISLSDNPEINEQIIQKEIAENPSILGLGDLVLKDTERIQPQAGRLDLLLQDPETQRRYEVEIQLGKVDESHIIRTIEYWDRERKRYPQYDHCAVIVAEDITARFFNIINLFNGHIPLIAIKMQASQIGENIGLNFITVLDELVLGTDEEDEVKEITDRNYWIKNGSEITVKTADKILEFIQSFTEGYEFNYNKFYIGLTKNKRPNNFATFRPKRKLLNLEIKLPYSDEIQKKIDESGIKDAEYFKKWGIYRFRLDEKDVQNNQVFLTELLQTAYKNSQ
ncbi:MAG: hypothetical protein KAV41_00260 [Candidatus Pacebacteria bacterium]|nr:hypothetical protein [Candidatus Paceibacterota bacterium]